MPPDKQGRALTPYTVKLHRVELDPRFAEEAAQVARSLVGYRVGNDPAALFALVEECVRRAYSGERIHMVETKPAPDEAPVFDARYGAKWLTSLLVCMSTIAAHAIHAKVEPAEDDEDDFQAGVALYEELCLALQIDGITH